MISVDEALAHVLSLAPVLPAERRPILEALGQVLDEEIYAGYDVPPHDNAAMDGYAVRWEDTRGASEEHPVALRVIGNLGAGYAPELAVQRGTALRIMTGAVIPPGATAVVQFEHTDEGQLSGGQREALRPSVKVFRPAGEWLNIRRAGEDVRQGALIVRRGSVIRPAEVGVLASMGVAEVSVIRRPRVAILSTGDELVDVNESLGPGKIRDSNRYALAAQVLRCGGVPVILGISRDTEDELSAKLREAQARADMLLTSAGVSVGDYDFTKKVLAREGEIGFWQVRMRPGKPLAFGRVGRIPHLGLPGNPVSAMLAFELFGRPALLKMMGKTSRQRPEVEAVMHGAVENRDGRRSFFRVFVSREDGQWHARLTGPQGSGILTSMALANGLLVVPEEVRWALEGDRVRVMMLDWPEEVATGDR